jgi:hypothetical protein
MNPPGSVDTGERCRAGGVSERRAPDADEWLATGRIGELLPLRWAELMQMTEPATVATA